MDSSNTPRKPRRSEGDGTPGPKKPTAPKSKLSSATDSTKKPRRAKSTPPEVSPATQSPLQTSLPPESSASPAETNVQPASDSAFTSSALPSSETRTAEPSTPIQGVRPISPDDAQVVDIPRTSLVSEAQTPEAPIQSDVLPLPRRAVALARTLLLRDIEIGRRIGTRASTSTRQGSNAISARVMTTTRSLAKNSSDFRARARPVLRAPVERIDDGLTRLQQNLEKSDTVVIAVTLGLIVACIVLTILAVYWWNHS